MPHVIFFILFYFNSNLALMTKKKRKMEKAQADPHQTL